MTSKAIAAGTLALAMSAATSCFSQMLHVEIDSQGGYRLSAGSGAQSALSSQIAAEVDGKWIHSADYPRHSVKASAVIGVLGRARQWDVTFSGLDRGPDLEYVLRAYENAPAADVLVTVRNQSGVSHTVSAIRAIEAPRIDLDGPAAEDRILSDSFSEDRPAMTIRDLADAPHGMHRAVGSQLVYNRRSRQSLFVGALDSNKFLTILRLHMTSSKTAPAQIASYEAESTGTTEVEAEESLHDSPPDDRMPLQLPLPAGRAMASERLLIDLGHDYHRQLEAYGALIRNLHHARTQAPPLFGWWSWTAYYSGLNQGAALTNAEWLAQHLKAYGYSVFHIDESYQYARGEYGTPDASHFPNGMGWLEDKVRSLGLLPGIWTAPFEVSDRSWVYQHHPEWLVKNAAGHPIHVGTVETDHLYVLDATHPGAQQYLRDTYYKLVHDWGIHYIKMDFMDDTAVEGIYYRPNTTALEAQRIGLGVIRQVVGESVLLDKDGSPMLNAVGYVDYGRISQDTGHTFEASRDAATGIAARYYMNRNFFVSDPDAFSVSRQTIADQPFHGKVPLTMDEARVSIALAAISGGMMEIGDALPAFENAPDRLQLLENQDLLDMVRLRRASVPIDLLDYRPEDHQPSIFLLKESPRQSILSVFNWTDGQDRQSVSLVQLGLAAAGDTVSDVFSKKAIEPMSGTLELSLPPHSVRVLKIETPGAPEKPTTVSIRMPGSARSGETIALSSRFGGDDPALEYEWSFGDGVSDQGAQVEHTWVAPGDYRVELRVKALSRQTYTAVQTIHVTAHMPTRFEPSESRRYTGR